MLNITTEDLKSIPLGYRKNLDKLFKSEEELGRFLLSRKTDETKINKELIIFEHDVLNPSEEEYLDSRDVYEADIYLHFGQGEPICLKDAMIVINTFIYAINKSCKDMFFYRVVRDDKTRTIHFIQSRECTASELRHLLKKCFENHRCYR